MNISQYKCPNCSACFNNFSLFTQQQIKINLDKQYVFYLTTSRCENCKKDVRLFTNQITISWIKDYQFIYDKYVINKTKNKNKKYFYFYHPTKNKFIIQTMYNQLKNNDITTIITTQQFAQVIDFKKQMCVLPNKIFSFNKNTIFPNLLAQIIIINQSKKYQNSKLYSLYNTFFNNFCCLYKVKDWKNFIVNINEN